MHDISTNQIANILFFEDKNKRNDYETIENNNAIK